MVFPLNLVICNSFTSGSEGYAHSAWNGWCTAVREHENAIKRRKALLSEEELLVRTKSAKQVRELLKHVSRLCTNKNKTEHI